MRCGYYGQCSSDDCRGGCRLREKERRHVTRVRCQGQGCHETPSYHVQTSRGPELLCPECAALELAAPSWGAS